MLKYLEYIFALVSGWFCVYHPFLHWEWEGIDKGKLRGDLGSGNEGGGVLWVQISAWGSHREFLSREF